MSSATKTLELLNYFTPSRAEIGLSELCRLAKRDKGTTHRHLQDLEKSGFVEQNPRTREYRLGPAVLQLAQTREATVPRKAGAEFALRRLANASGETTHVSVLSGAVLHTLDSYEPPQHSIRVIIDVSRFPLHATASGLSVLAFGQPELVDAACENLKHFTNRTASSRVELEDEIAIARECGFGHADRTFEDEVYSVAIPLFDQTGHVAGAISVASVASRITEDAELRIRGKLIEAGREITRNWGGTIPAELEACWASTTKNSQVLDTAI